MAERAAVLAARNGANVIAPTDPQLAYIAALCRDRAIVPPDAVASKQEASEIIAAILSGTYDAATYAYDRYWLAEVPF